LDPAFASGLSKKAQEAVKGVFEAMHAWQSEATKIGEKNSKQVLEKMAEAAAALGWPEQVVEAARTQVGSIAEMQNKTLEQMRGVWEQQLRSPDAPSPQALMSKMKALPGFGTAPGWPNAEALQSAATAPLEMWMEFGKQWQKFWTDAFEKPHRH
jgi:hypothetical protein